jgi:hypothetical protein
MGDHTMASRSSFGIIGAGSYGRGTLLLKIATCAGALSLAQGVAVAWHFECRFIERAGNIDVPLLNNTIDVFDGMSRNIRVQFGVFDDVDGAAPAGGFVGWNTGTIAVSGPAGNSDERRNPGRLAPFNFLPGPNSNGNPPAPAGDPFTMLTDIDSTLGIQSPEWICVESPLPMPQPVAVVRGLNEFVSVYAFSIDPAQPSAVMYSVTVAGNLIAATEWRTVGNPSAPDCGDPEDPMDDIPGSVTYVPFPTAPRAFACTLNVGIPSPASVTILILLSGGAFLRRRSEAPC